MNYLLHKLIMEQKQKKEWWKKKKKNPRRKYVYLSYFKTRRNSGSDENNT